MSQHPPALFELIPGGLFGPLASANREHYWQLLCRLFDEFFGPDAPVPPSHGIPRREITAAVERYLLSDDPWEVAAALARHPPTVEQEALGAMRWPGG